MRKKIWIAALFGGLSLSALAEEISLSDIGIEQRFCLFDRFGNAYRGCNAFLKNAICPNLQDAGAQPKEVKFSDEWTIVLEGDSECPPLVVENLQLASNLRIYRSENSLRQGEDVAHLLFATDRAITVDDNEISYLDDAGDSLRLGALAAELPGPITDFFRTLPWYAMFKKQSEQATGANAIRWQAELSEAMFAAQFGVKKENSRVLLYFGEANRSITDNAIDLSNLVYALRSPATPVLYSGAAQQGGNTDARLATLLKLIEERVALDHLQVITNGSGIRDLIRIASVVKKPSLGIDKIVLIAPPIEQMKTDKFKQLASLSTHLTVYTATKSVTTIQALSGVMLEVSTELEKPIDIVSVAYSKLDNLSSINSDQCECTSFLDELDGLLNQGLPARQRENLSAIDTVGLVETWALTNDE